MDVNNDIGQLIIVEIQFVVYSNRSRQQSGMDWIAVYNQDNFITLCLIQPFKVGVITCRICLFFAYMCDHPCRLDIDLRNIYSSFEYSFHMRLCDFTKQCV